MYHVHHLEFQLQDLQQHKLKLKIQEKNKIIKLFKKRLVYSLFFILINLMLKIVHFNSFLLYYKHVRNILNLDLHLDFLIKKL